MADEERSRLLEHTLIKKTIFEQTFSYLSLVAIRHLSYIEIFSWKNQACVSL